MGASLGKFLQGCREQAGLTSDAMAKALKISAERLYALESDRFDLFDDEVDLKRVLTEYAEMVDLSPGAVERLYQRQKQRAAKGTIFSATVEPPIAAIPSDRPPPSTVRPARTRPNRRRSFPWAVLFVLPIIAAVAYFVWQKAEITPSTSPLPTTAQPAAVVKSHAMIPLGGGEVRLTAIDATRFQLSIDRRDVRKYRIESDGSLSWQVSSLARFTFEHPEKVQLWVNETPVPQPLDADIQLVPQQSGAQ